MRPSTTLALLLVALSTSTLGCRDAAPSGPERALDNRSGSGDGSDASAGASGSGASSDSSSAPEQPGSTTGTPDGPTQPDTAVQSPPPRPASFTLAGFARGAASTSDTTQTVPLGGVTANLYRIKTADGSPVQPEVLAGSVVVDANGAFTFRDVASAHYRLEVKAPPGGPYVDGSVTIVPPWSSAIAVYVVLPRKG
jgi:hypothetical protein